MSHCLLGDKSSSLRVKMFRFPMVEKAAQSFLRHKESFSGVRKIKEGQRMLNKRSQYSSRSTYHFMRLPSTMRSFGSSQCRDISDLCIVSIFVSINLNASNDDLFRQLYRQSTRYLSVNSVDYEDGKPHRTKTKMFFPKLTQSSMLLVGEGAMTKLISADVIKTRKINNFLFTH